MGLNPLRAAFTATALVPDPIDWDVVELEVESVLLVPHSNQTDVAAPFGFTEPFSVAPFVVTEEAAVVVTDGKTAAVTQFQTAE